MNVVCVGAHPDDAEVYAGGTCAKWAHRGFRVLLVSMTNGDIGHHEAAGGTLSRRRATEARRSAERAGCHELVLGHHDGELMPTIETRKDVVRILRRWKADLVLTHRPNDYHPDHRYTSQVVQDAAFMVTVPNFCPESPRLERNPVFLYLADTFQKPAPFHPDIAVDVDDTMPVKWDMLDAMESQMYEWLPWLDGTLEQVPQKEKERRLWLQRTWDPFWERMARMARPALVKWYGAKHARKVRCAEVFEICEYGHQPSVQEILQLFPFIPGRRRRASR
ncbi:MAG: PIG-L family deacetylase [Candidatus Hydrogenedentes bacterium]|nr:PIG-L family deacetylase [Candidatus Hydrogenedentota bacterium]